MRNKTISIITVILIGSFLSNSHAVFLNSLNTTISLGSSMTAEPFHNRIAADSLASIIDASSAVATETHTQSTHVYVNGGTLEVDFNFGAEYDLITFHFWNYFTEGFDVDDIDFKFFDSSNTLVGNIDNIAPQIGGGNPISAENLALSFPTNVQFINAVLSGSNTQVDFNNIGFTGELSVIPEPLANLLIIFVTVSIIIVTILAASYEALKKKKNFRVREASFEVFIILQ